VDVGWIVLHPCIGPCSSEHQLGLPFDSGSYEKTEAAQQDYRLRFGQWYTVEFGLIWTTVETCLSSASDCSACTSRRSIQHRSITPATHTLGRTKRRRDILGGLLLRGQFAIALIALRGLRNRRCRKACRENDCAGKDFHDSLQGLPCDKIQHGPRPVISAGAFRARRGRFCSDSLRGRTRGSPENCPPTQAPLPSCSRLFNIAVSPNIFIKLSDNRMRWLDSGQKPAIGKL